MNVDRGCRSGSGIEMEVDRRCGSGSGIEMNVDRGADLDRDQDADVSGAEAFLKLGGRAFASMATSCSRGSRSQCGEARGCRLPDLGGRRTGGRKSAEPAHAGDVAERHRGPWMHGCAFSPKWAVTKTIALAARSDVPASAGSGRARTSRLRAPALSPTARSIARSVAAERGRAFAMSEHMESVGMVGQRAGGLDWSAAGQASVL